MKSLFADTPLKRAALWATQFAWNRNSCNSLLKYPPIRGYLYRTNTDTTNLPVVPENLPEPDAEPWRLAKNKVRPMYIWLILVLTYANMNIEHFIRVHTSLSSFPSAASSEKHVYLIIVLSKQFMTLKEKMEVTNTAEKITHMYPTNKKVSKYLFNVAKLLIVLI